MSRKSCILLLLIWTVFLLLSLRVTNRHRSNRFVSTEDNQPTGLTPTSIEMFDELKPIVEETTHSFGLLLLIISILMCIMVIYALLRLNLHFLPGSVAVILIGMILGASIKAIRKDLEDIVKFNAENFFLFLLPPIIFESGYTVNKGNFIGNLGTIHVFALGGTVISAITVGIGMYLIGLIPYFYSLSFFEW